jgi:hypothetical protein
MATSSEAQDRKSLVDSRHAHYDNQYSGDDLQCESRSDGVESPAADTLGKTRESVARKSWRRATQKLLEKRRAEYECPKVHAVIEKAREATLQGNSQEEPMRAPSTLTMLGGAVGSKLQAQFPSVARKNERQPLTDCSTAETFINLKLIEWDKDESGTFDVDEVQIAMAELRVVQQSLSSLKTNMLMCSCLLFFGVGILMGVAAIILLMTQQTHVSDGSQVLAPRRGAGFEEVVTTTESTGEETLMNILDFDGPSDQWATTDEDLRELHTVSFGTSDNVSYHLSVAEVIRIDTGPSGSADKVEILSTSGHSLRLWESVGQLEVKWSGSSLWQALNAENLASSRRATSSDLNFDEEDLLQDNLEYDPNRPDMFEPPAMPRRAKGVSSTSAVAQRGSYGMSGRMSGIGVARMGHVGHTGGSSSAWRSCSCQVLLSKGNLYHDTQGETVILSVMNSWLTAIDGVSSISLMGDEACRMKVMINGTEQSFQYTVGEWENNLPTGDSNIEKVKMHCGGSAAKFRYTNTGSAKHSCARCYVPWGELCEQHCNIGECYYQSGAYVRCNCRAQQHVHAIVTILLLASAAWRITANGA